MDAFAGAKRPQDVENFAPVNELDAASPFKQARPDEAIANPLLSPAL